MRRGGERLLPSGPSVAAVAAPLLAAALLVLPLRAGSSRAHPAPVGAAGDGAAAADTLVGLHRAWPVMGTLFDLEVRAPDEPAARAAARAARAVVSRVDSLMSTYRSDSEISAVNRAAGTGRWVELSPWSWEVLTTSVAWARASRGAFDPTVGPLARVWGFHGGAPGRPSPQVGDSAARLVGWQGIELDSARRRARLAREGARLTFGAIAKGFALDRAAEAMRKAGAVSGQLDLGGNVRVLGAAPTGGGAWLLGVRHPRRPDRLLGTVRVREGSVATSGDTEQFFEEEGIRYSHIMDPRAGRPARGVAQVTVVAASGLAADALSTTLFVLGPEEGRRFLASEAAAELAPGAAALWVRDPGAVPVAAGDLLCAGEGAARFETLVGAEGCGAGGGDGFRRNFPSPSAKDSVEGRRAPDARGPATRPHRAGGPARGDVREE